MAIHRELIAKKLDFLNGQITKIERMELDEGLLTHGNAGGWSSDFLSQQSKVKAVSCIRKRAYQKPERSRF